MLLRVLWVMYLSKNRHCFFIFVIFTIFRICHHFLWRDLHNKSPLSCRSLFPSSHHHLPFFRKPLPLPQSSPSPFPPSPSAPSPLMYISFTAHHPTLSHHFICHQHPPGTAILARRHFGVVVQLHVFFVPSHPLTGAFWGASVVLSQLVPLLMILAGSSWAVSRYIKVIDIGSTKKKYPRC